MTPFPHTVGVELSLAAATRRMRRLGVRHLPVMDDGRLAGLVSERDLAFANAHSGDPEKLTVELAMTPEPFVVGPAMPLGTVLRTMADQRLGSAVVVDDGTVVGLLTSTDVAAAFADLLLSRHLAGEREFLPSAIRKRALNEHRTMRRQIDLIEELSGRILGGNEDLEGELRLAATDLYRTLNQHILMVEALVVPVLESADAFGPQRRKALEEEHARQKNELRKILAVVAEEGTGPVRTLAEALGPLIEALRSEIAHEEQAMKEDLFRDDVLNVSFTG
ncbi:MAG: CBS domain-containing protein [Myxococcota bacterium]